MMDQSEIVVSFKLSADEASRQTAELQKQSGVTKTTIRIQCGVAVLWLALGISEVASNHLRPSGWISIILGCWYFVLAFQLRSRIIDVPAGVETLIHFRTKEIVVERPAPRTLPWSAVKSMDRYRGGLSIRLASEVKPALEQRIVLPKQAFEDDGIALWHLAEQQLLGPLRRVSAQLSVDERGALRRTDANHIENLRARRDSKPVPQATAG